MVPLDSWEADLSEQDRSFLDAAASPVTLTAIVKSILVGRECLQVRCGTIASAIPWVRLLLPQRFIVVYADVSQSSGGVLAFRVRPLLPPSTSPERPPPLSFRPALQRLAAQLDCVSWRTGNALYFERRDVVPGMYDRRSRSERLKHGDSVHRLDETTRRPDLRPKCNIKRLVALHSPLVPLTFTNASCSSQLLC